MGRATKQQAVENRAHVVEVASRLFLRDGLKGTAITDLMAEAGLTHGGFYRQFASKDAVAGEACACAMRRSIGHWQRLAAQQPEAPVVAIASGYLDAPASRNHCPLPRLAGEVAGEAAASEVRTAFTEGVHGMADTLADCAAPAPRDRALALLAAMVGAVSLARAVNDDALAKEILEAVRDLAART